jgi:hypothetical protein
MSVRDSATFNLLPSHPATKASRNRIVRLSCSHLPVRQPGRRPVLQPELFSELEMRPMSWSLIG